MAGTRAAIMVVNARIIAAANASAAPTTKLIPTA